MAPSTSFRQTWRLWLALAVVAAVPAVAVASPPHPVSPGGMRPGQRVEARCPTFSWAGVAGASGYELAVFRISDSDRGEPALVTRATLPANAETWTPGMEQCLERGGRYAWSVAAVPRPSEVDAGVTLEWAQELHFEVDAGPAGPDVRQALATLRTCLADAACARELGRDEVPAPTPPEARRAAGFEQPAGREATTPRRSRGRDAVERSQRAATIEAIESRTDVTRAASNAMTPTLGSPSLRVSGNVALGPQSNVFRDGYVFIWGDGIEGNTALGRAALSSVTGHTVGNTAVGRYALQRTNAGAASGQPADYNTAIGDQALRFNTTGWSNTGLGSNALFANTTGANNTAVGKDALLGNETGSTNTALGSNALFINDDGSGNTAVGFFALLSNTSGDQNVASGVHTLRENTTGSDNTATGSHALRANTTGNANTAAGAYALRYNTQGFDNTAHGADALHSNTTGDRNTASGNDALRSNTLGNENTATGAFALHDNVGGSRNTALGGWSLLKNETGNANTAVGFDALLGNSAGSRNVAVGYRAGQHATGSDNIFILNEGVAGESHTLRIGQTTHNIGVGAIDKAFIHGIAGRTPGASAAAVQIGTDGKLGVAMSTRRVKQDIRELEEALTERLLALRPVAFRYREHVADDPDTPLEYGLIAEEVAEVFPELVIRDAQGRPLTVRYHLLGSLLLGELQRLHERVEALESRPSSRRERPRRRAVSR